jgi:hypothetical protein
LVEKLPPVEDGIMPNRLPENWAGSNTEPRLLGEQTCPSTHIMPHGCRDSFFRSYGITEHLTKHALLFCVDTHRDGRRFIVKADDLLTTFLSLKRDAIVPKGANENATGQNVA